MSNIFDIRRFGSYVRMNYFYHRKQYLAAIIGALVMLFLMMCKFRFANYATTWESNRLPIDSLISIFSGAFYFTGSLFMIWIVRVSMLGIGGKSFTMYDLLLPVSAFERYLFALINSTVVASLLYIIVFQVASSFAESMYLMSDNGYLYKGFVGYAQSMAVNGEFVQECHISLWSVVSDILIPGSVRYVSAGLIYAMFVSVFMWGEITFRNRGAVILTMVVHIALAGATIALFSLSSYKSDYPTGYLRVSYDLGEFVNTCEVYVLSLLYVVPIAYQWVVWRKIKGLSLARFKRCDIALVLLYIVLIGGAYGFSRYVYHKQEKTRREFKTVVDNQDINSVVIRNISTRMEVVCAERVGKWKLLAQVNQHHKDDMYIEDGVLYIEDLGDQRSVLRIDPSLSIEIENSPNVKMLSDEELAKKLENKKNKWRYEF